MVSKGDSSFRKPKRAMLPLFSLLLITGLFRSSQNAIQTTFAPFGYEILRLSPSIVGFGMTLVGGFAALANLFLVSRLNSFRLRRVAIFGFVALSFAILNIVIGKSLPTYLDSAIILGISGGLTMPVLATLAGRVPGVKRDRALAAYAVALSAGLAIGPFIESIFLSANHGSLLTSFLIFIPFPLIAAALVLNVEDQVSSTVNAKQGATYPATIAKNNPLRLAIVGQLLYQVPFVAAVTFGALIAHSIYDVSTSLAQLSFSVFFAFSLASRMILVWKPSGNSSSLVLRISAIVTLFGVVLLGVGRDPIYFLLAMALLGVPHGFIYPVSISLIARGTITSDIPRANSILFASTSIVSVVGPFVLGVVVTELGYRAMLVLVLIPVLALSLMLFRISLGPGRNSRLPGDLA